VENNLLMQIQADLLGVDVVRPQIQETTALGAAYLAGLAVGYWNDIAELQQQWQMDRRFVRHARAEDVERGLAAWHRAIRAAKAWADAAS
jgi:glycerol kinase